MRPSHRAALKTDSQIALLRCPVLRISAEDQGADPLNLRHLQKKYHHLLCDTSAPVGFENIQQMYVQVALIAVQSDFSRANRIGNYAIFMLAEIHPCSAWGPEYIAHDRNKVTDIVVAVKADDQLQVRVLQVGFLVGSEW